MQRSMWSFICAGADAPPIWDLQDLNPCWQIMFYFISCAVLIIPVFYNVGIVTNLQKMSGQPTATGLQRRNSRRWVVILSTRAVLNIVVAAVFAAEILLTQMWQPAKGAFATASSLFAATSFIACAFVDLCALRLPQATILTSLAVTTQILLWLPVYVLHVLDFRRAVVLNFSDEQALQVCCIAVFTLQTLVLLCHMSLLLIKRSCLRQAIAHARMPLEAEADDELRVDESADLKATLGKAEDGLGRGVLSFVLFLWVNPLIKLGSTEPLESYEQLFDLPDGLQSMDDTVQLGEHLNCKRNKVSRIFVIRALWKVFGWRWLAVGVFQLLLSLVNYIPPLMLGGVVSYLEVINSNDDERKRELDDYSGIYYAAGIVLTSFVAGLLSVHRNYQISRLQLSVRGAIMDLVYGKLLHVRACDLSAEMESSQVMNLIGTDCERIVENLIDVHYFWTMPIFIVITLYLLYLQVGVAFVAGVGFAFLLIPVNHFLARWIARLFDAQMAEQDSRVKLLSECLSAMRVIKLHAWEPYFQQRLQKIRNLEMRHWKYIKYVDGFCAFFWESSPIIILVLTFTLYVLLGNTLTAAKTFTTISIFHLFMVPMLVMPWMIQGASELWISVRRLQKYLSLSVVDFADYYDSATTTTGGDPPYKSLLKINNMSFRWKTSSSENADDSKSCFENENLEIDQSSGNSPSLSDEQANVAGGMQKELATAVDADLEAQNLGESGGHTGGMVVVEPAKNSVPTLKQLNLELFGGELIGVVGRVGSGKTSLLMALIAEMHHLRENEDKLGSLGSTFSIQPNLLRDGFGVALQDVWIQQGTVKENILCCTRAGVKTLQRKRIARDDPPRLNQQDEQRYNDIIDACALRYDVLGALPHGDATEIGEHGVTLSGGQRARIALARACYADKPIILLDDPLSAVDANVAQHIFSKCVRGLLRHKTVVLVTHHVDFLRYAADRVIVMHDGRIVKCGPPADVLNDEQFFTEKVDKSKLDEVPAAEEEVEMLSVIDRPASPDREIAKIEAAADMFDDMNQGTNSTIVVALNSALIDDEEREYGVVRFAVWKEFCKSIGWVPVVLVLISYAFQQTSRVSTDFWLAYWTSESELAENTTPNDSRVIVFTRPLRITALSDGGHHEVDNWYYLKMYIALAGVNCFCNIYRSFSFVYAEINVSSRMHDVLLSTLMYATQQFYDTTPSGRIINRYGSDISVVDAELPPNIHYFIDALCSLLGAFVIICVGLPWFTLVIVPVMPWYIWIQHLYRKTSREVQRILTLTRSPIYSWFTESIKGLPHIRAMRMSDRFYAEFRSMLNANQRVRYTEVAASGWLDLRLQMVGAVLVSSVVILALAIQADAAVTGLALAYALAVVELLSNILMSFIHTEQQMVSVERIMQYVTGAEREKYDDDADIRTADLLAWPERGEIVFENVKLRYRDDLPDLYALSGVSLVVKQNEKIAVVGRTGAGKSSMLQALFRTVELAGGRILVDDIDIKHVSLKDLRSRLAIIPQNPMLFDASLRHNIDPLERHSSDDVISAIKSCLLENVVQKLGGWTAAMDGGTEASTLGEAGARLSMGERQLVCLARALVSKSKILCLDEATASVDHETDEHIQIVLRKAFEHSTVICIAHRIQTIRDYDRVAVMKDGCIVECDSPRVLMANTQSLFYQLATAHTR